MSMRDADHGGIIKKPVVNGDLWISIASTSDYNASISPSYHGGITPQDTNYQGIETYPPELVRGVNVKYFPPLPSGLVVAHGGPFENVQGTIVNDTQ